MAREAHHREGRGKISYGGSIWDPSHGRGGGGGRAWCIICVRAGGDQLKKNAHASVKWQM